MNSQNNLNSAQKSAVEYNDGPLLIVAGAGTGKTTVITQKIAHLIGQNSAKPEQILALTFTEKAAAEMSDRVDVLLKKGYADLQISTFHSFCQRILEHYGLHIGIPNQFRLVTETDAWLLVRKNLDKFNLNYYKPLGNPSRYIREMLAHFSKCKDELIAPKDYLRYAEGVKKDKGDMNTDEKTRLSEIADAYHAYNQLFLDNNALDFGDLIFYVIRLLEERPEILKNLRARYQYVLVDEFQDVNWAQYRLVQMIAGEKDVRLMVVGDDDQSIYAFRGASVSNILHFKEDYPQAKEIVLTDNYRSRQDILDLAYNLIQNNNPDRLEAKLKIDKRLRSMLASSKEKSVVYIHSSTVEEEVNAVVKEIEGLRAIHKDATWDDFAILVRANSHVEPFLAGLERRNIPYEYIAAAGLYREPAILDCVNFFKLLDNYHESTAVFRLLQAPFWQVKEDDLQKIASYAKRKSISFYDALLNKGILRLSPEASSAADKLISLITALSRRVRFDKPSVVLYEFLEQSGYLKYLLDAEEKGERQGIRQIYHLKQFFEYLSNYESLTPGANVSEFLEHYNYTVESGDKGAVFQVRQTPDSVNILTVHASKGLEFRFVFVVNLVEERFPTRERGEAIEIPTELIKEQLPEGNAHLEEERRLLYVAMTRAKERLYLTSASDYGGARAKKISRFLVELGFAVGSEKSLSLKKETLLNFKQSKTKTDAKFVYEPPASFSFSQVRSYRICPYQYKLAHVIKFQPKGSASLSFGSTMHNTLLRFYSRVQEMNGVSQISLFDQPTPLKDTAGKVKTPTQEELLKIYEECWISDWYLSKSQREAYFHKGKELLKEFWRSNEDKWTVPAVLEGGFKIRMGEYVLGGRIDRIDKLADGKLEIIDYKTGESKDKLGSEDKEQLLIYQMAAETLLEYQELGAPGTLTFYYLDDGTKQSFLGEAKELEKLQEKIIGVIEKIHAKEFGATPEKFACARCDFKDICDFRI